MKKTHAIAIDAACRGRKEHAARVSWRRRWASAMWIPARSIARWRITMALMGIGPKDTDGVTRLLDDVNLDIRRRGRGSI